MSPLFYRHRKLCSFSRAEKNLENKVFWLSVQYPVHWTVPILRIVTTINHRWSKLKRMLRIINYPGSLKIVDSKDIQWFILGKELYHVLIFIPFKSNTEEKERMKALWEKSHLFFLHTCINGQNVWDCVHEVYVRTPKGWERELCGTETYFWYQTPWAYFQIREEKNLNRTLNTMWWKVFIISEELFPSGIHHRKERMVTENKACIPACGVALQHKDSH